MTIDKAHVLQSWILVERLSEGEIKKEKKQRLRKLNIGDDFYTTFTNGLKNKGNKAGVVVYCDVIPLKDVICALGERYNTELDKNATYEGDRISYALYLDSNLKFICGNTFVSANSYIVKKRESPTPKGLYDYREAANKKLTEYFNESVDCSGKVIPGEFNKAMKTALRGECYYCVVENVDDNKIYNSQLTGDLEKAKKIVDENLDKYIAGVVDKKDIDAQRIDLDTKKSSPKFNKEKVAEILQPERFPLSRFPSNPEFAPSLMQQVAINLSIGCDVNQMQSVNGPPGTGKTTLLQDIFAEFVTEQAKEMAAIDDKNSSAQVVTLPDDIAKYGIVVASSNNGAVANITSDLPKMNRVKDFKELLIEADYFKAIANGNSESDENWGLFSMSGGKTENANRVLDTIESVYNELKNDYKSNTSAYKKFRDDYKRVKAIRDAIAKLSRIPSDESLKAIIEESKGKLSNIENEEAENRKHKLKWLKLSIKRIFCRDEKDKYAALCSEIDKLNKKIADANEKRALRKEIEDSVKDSRKYGGKDLAFDVSYRDLQVSSPWFTKEYRIEQTKLFISALKVRKQFLYENIGNIKAALDIWRDRYKRSGEELNKAWQWINLVIPVIGTTFASVGNMFNKLGPNSIGHLFIDEAGQATPWSGVGAIYRSQYVMAVGDPSQIPPVVTLEDNAIAFVGKVMKVSDEYLSKTTSVQTFIDAISRYGFYKDTDKEEWIGIPLWVHRRCKSPMFDISNAISYGGNMVQGKSDKDSRGHAEWWDIPGEASGKYYVKEQGEEVKRFIQSVQAGEKPEYDAEKIYIITPFRDVSDKLIQELDGIGFVKRENGKVANIGTIHTFQGKETDTVILVLGTDDASRSSASWAMGSSNANMMNVAATRAKKSLIIVGDKKLYKSLHSRVIDETLRAIDE